MARRGRAAPPAPSPAPSNAPASTGVAASRPGARRGIRQPMTAKRTQAPIPSAIRTIAKVSPTWARINTSGTASASPTTRDRQEQPAADARNLRQTLAVDGSEAEGDQHRQDRQHGQEVARIDGVAECKHHHHDGAPQHEQADRRWPGARRKLGSRPRGEPEQEEGPAEEGEDAHEHVAGKRDEHPAGALGRVPADLVAEELGAELRRVVGRGIGVPGGDKGERRHDRPRLEDRCEFRRDRTAPHRR